MKTKELLELVNNKKYLCLTYVEKDIESRENPPLLIRTELGSYGSCTLVLLDIYQCEDGFVGITGFVQTNNEYTPEFLDEPCIAEEYSPIPSTDYVPTAKIKAMGFRKRVELSTKDSEL